jgi:hypothetical protein
MLIIEAPTNPVPPPNNFENEVEEVKEGTPEVKQEDLTPDKGKDEEETKQSPKRKLGNCLISIRLTS